MSDVRRRALVAAAATLASGWAAGNSRAAESFPIDRLKLASGGALPAVAIRGADGAEKPLTAFAGAPLVLNLWATWCVPCVAEMPALDRLAAMVAPGIAVVALSSDRGGAAAVERFYRERQITHLPVSLDPGGAAARALGARGIPTTLIIGADGKERARLEGAADWASPEAVAAIRRLVGQGA